MSIIAGIGAGIGALGALGGMFGSRRVAEREQRELENRAAKNEAWYHRNYYGDYLNSVEATNAIRRVKDTLVERSQMARARQVVAGGTPEQAIAAEQEYAKSMADVIGNLAAQGEAYKRDVDARKAQLDAEVSGQRQAIASQQQAANASLMGAGLNAVMSGLSQFDFDKKLKK